MPADNDNQQVQCYLLHFAVDECLIDIVKIFLEQDQIPIDTINERGWSLLHLAAGHNQVDIIKLLINNGANVNIQVGQIEYR
jgi:ankyrin repeat protein